MLISLGLGSNTKICIWSGGGEGAGGCRGVQGRGEIKVVQA